LVDRELVDSTNRGWESYAGVTLHKTSLPVIIAVHHGFRQARAFFVRHWFKATVKRPMKMKSNCKNKNIQGFTLLEIITVLAIIGVLAGIAIPAFENGKDKARVLVTISEIKTIQNKIMEYFDENKCFPPSLADIGFGDQRDPWGNPYQYLRITGKPGEVGKLRKDRNTIPINTDFDLYSKGKDGKTVSALTAQASQDDIVRANNGGYIGLASEY
jgi:general secretion pathway protein G